MLESRAPRLGNEIIKGRAMIFATELYEMMKKDNRFKDMDYGQFMMTLDYLYGELSAKIYKDTFHKEKELKS
jgi:Lhr-like helicase